MRLYLGGVDYASVRAQTRLYQKTLRDVRCVAEKHNMETSDAWDQIERQARKLGPIRPKVGQDI